MSKNFPRNPLEPVSEQKLCSEKIADVSLYWCDGQPDFSYGVIAHAQIALTAVQPLTDLGLALCIFDDLGRCAFASPHAPLESESSAGPIAAGPQQVSLWFQTCLPPGRYALSFSLAERSADTSDDPAGWEVLCQQTHYLPFSILEGGTPAPPPGYAQIQTYSVLENQTAVESLPKSEALDHFPWTPAKYTLPDILAMLDVTLPDRIAAKATVELPDTLDTQQLPLRLPANHARFHTLVGRRSNLGVSTTGKAGVLLYGPYMAVAPGAYEVVFDIHSASASDEAVVLDVVADNCGWILLGETEWRAGDKNPAKIVFEVPEPGVTNLECRVKVSSSSDCVVEAVTFLTSKQAELHLACIDHLLCNDGYFRPNRVVLSICIDRVWLQCHLAIAKYLYDNRGWKTIFVMRDTFYSDDFFSGLDCVLGHIQLDGLKDNLSALYFQPDIICVHADNFGDIVEQVFSLIPHAELICHADGFRNSAHGTKIVKEKKPKEIFYYGFGDRRNIGNTKSSVVLPSIYFDFADSYTQSFLDRREDPGEYSIFFLRYWGLTPYEFPSSAVVASWLSTTSKFIGKNETLILKGSNYFDQNIVDIFASKLTQLGYRVTFLSEYLAESGLSKFGSASYEQLLRRGILCSPKYIFTLDSSIPSLLAALPYLNRNCKVIAGAVNAEEISGCTAWKNTVGNNLEQQINCLKSLPDWQVVDFPYEPDLFLIESTKSDLNLATRGSIPHHTSLPPKYRQEQPWLERHAEICAHSDKPAPQLMCFGDSLTQGMESHSDLLQQYLPYSILNAGFSGDRTEHLLWRLKDGEGKDLSPKVVLVWIGTNDIGQIQPTPPAEQVFCNIRAVCRELEARFPMAKKVLMGLLPRDASAVHPFRRVIKEVNALLSTYAQEQGWHFMDEGERFVDEAGHLRMDYLPDGLHLNQAGYAVLLQAIQPRLQTLINPQAIAN